MPLYEYRCTGCGERIEVLQRLGEARLTECPSCHGVLERLISASALRFKGSGFYITDYPLARADAAPETAKSEAKTASDASPASSGDQAKPKPASKPAVKPDSAKKSAPSEG